MRASEAHRQQARLPRPLALGSRMADVETLEEPPGLRCPVCGGVGEELAQGPGGPCCPACGGVGAVVAAMQQHVSSAGVQEQGCDALRKLAINSQNQVAIAAKGGVEAVVAAMQQHMSSAGVQEQGCGALSCLAVNAENKGTIAAKGGVEALVEAMQQHVGSEGVRRTFHRGALAFLFSRFFPTP